MRKTALNISKYLGISLLLISIFAASLVYIQKDKNLRKDVQAATLDLGMTPSLDVDVAPDGPAYTTKIDPHYRRAAVANYHYLSDSDSRALAPNTPDVQFGKAIAQAKIGGIDTFLPGQDPTSSRISANVGAVEGIDWHMGNNRLYRDVVQNAKRVYRCDPINDPPCPDTFQYNVQPYGANQRGFVFVSSNTIEDCINVANRQSFRIATTHNRFKTLSPGTPFTPNTDNLPIYYRFGRGVIKSIFSADGNVAMIVETRVYYDNVCTFASMTADEAETDMSNQKLSNVSFPVVALVTYNRRAADGQKWKTVNLSQQTYKTAIIPNNGFYDAVLWGANLTGTLGESITFGNPAGTKSYNRLDSMNPDKAYYRNWFPTFNNGGSGTVGGLALIGITNIFGSSGVTGKSVEVIRDCGGFSCSYGARDVMGTIEPVFKADDPTNSYSNGTLYITLYSPVFDDNGAYGRSYILALKNAGDLNKPLNQINYRQFNAQDFPRGDCLNYTTVLDPGAVHNACIDDPANALGVTPPSKVPLLQRGNFLRYTGPQIFPDATGTAGSGFFEDPVGRQITNGEMQQLPIKGLNSSVMAGSYFIDQGVEKNIIAIADNNTKLVWIGGENLEIKPKLKAFNDPVCDTSDRINPYKMRFTIQTESGTNANIAYNFAVLTPALGASPNPPVTFTFNTSTNQITGSTNSNYVVATTSGNTNNAQYTSTITPFIASREPNFTFLVEFKDRDFYENFYSTGGFDLYLYIKDSNSPANTNIVGGNKLERVFANKAFDSFESCTSPFFSTAKGDFRSKESRGISAQKANKFWKKDTTSVTDTYSTKTNGSATQLPTASDFGFEWHRTGSESCESRIKRTQTINDDFCLQVESNYDLTQKGTDGIVTRFLNETLQESKQKELVNVINIDATSTSPLLTPVVVGSSTIHQLNLNAIPDKTKPTLIEINAQKYSSPDFIITDSIDPALTPDILIVKCNIVDCTLRLDSITSLSGSDSISTDNTTSPPSLKYGYSSIDALVKRKSRLYVNYSFSTVGYDAKENYSTTSPDPDVRTFVLKVANTANSDKNNVYLGGILNSGYLYSDVSSKTNIIKGLVITRGIIARGTAPGIKNLYFKDFIYPFMYIDYDPKLMLKFRTIFSQPPSDVVREYVGL